MNVGDSKLLSSVFLTSRIRPFSRRVRIRSGMDAEEDGAGPSVVVVVSDSAGPSATVTEVSRSEIWWCWSQRVNAVEDYRRSE